MKSMMKSIWRIIKLIIGLGVAVAIASSTVYLGFRITDHQSSAAFLLGIGVMLLGVVAFFGLLVAAIGVAFMDKIKEEWGNPNHSDKGEP